MKYKPEIVVKWFAEHGIFAIPEYRFNEKRKWRFDFALASLDKPRPLVIEKLALEVQGGLFTGGRHSRGPALLKEHEKLNAAACAGWRILYCIPDNLCMMETIDLIREALKV